MCGIFMLLNGEGKMNNLYAAIARDLALAGNVRGTDGFGMFQLDKSNKKASYFIDKTAALTVEDVEKGQFAGFLADAKKAEITVGHHRAATVGGVSKAATQPFFADRADGSFFGGVHNGTLYSWNENGPNGIKYNSDSEWAINKLADDYDGALSKEIDGAYTFVTYDSAKPDEVVVSLNGERPFAFTFVEGSNVLVAASEVEMLAWIMRRNKVKPANGDYFECQPYTKYVFDLKNLRAYTKTEIPKPTTTKSSWLDDKYWDAWEKRDAQRAASYASTSRKMGPEESHRDKFAQSIKDLVSEAIIAARTASQRSLIPAVETPSSPSTTTTSGDSASFPVLTTAGRPLVLAEEIKHFAEMGFKPGSEGLFLPTRYDKNIEVLHGEVLLQDAEGCIEMMNALIRKIDPATAEMYLTHFSVPGARELDVQCVGSYTYERSYEDRGVELKIICVNPKIAITPKSTAEEVV